MNIVSNKKNIIILVVAVLCIAGSLMTIRSREVQAANYFGGMRTAMLSCTCSGNTLIYINNYARGGGQLALIYDGSGRIFPNNNIFGTYLLGSYTPGGSCRVGAEPYCTTVNVDGRFDSMPGTGTS